MPLASQAIQTLLDANVIQGSPCPDAASPGEKNAAAQGYWHGLRVALLAAQQAEQAYLA